MQSFKVDSIEAGSRLDSYLVVKIPDLSRSSVQKLITTDRVKVNNQDQPSKYKLRTNDQVSVEFDPSELDEIPEIDLPIIYEDDDCIVINKPVGILTHSKGGFNLEATVATFIRPKIVDMSGERAGIVHRLDRATSGVMICAKTSEALRKLQKQFSSRKVKKQYLAIIFGQLDPAKAVIDLPIGRNPRNPKTFTVVDSGKSAVTEYSTLKTSKKSSLIELWPKTGRTHQLRVHLSHLGHPILGDEFYGGPKANRLMLHAQSLEITLPKGERRIFTADTPSEFEDIIDG